MVDDELGVMDDEDVEEQLYVVSMSSQWPFECPPMWLTLRGSLLSSLADVTCSLAARHQIQIGYTSRPVYTTSTVLYSSAG